jgi:hypothetical protein
MACTGTQYGGEFNQTLFLGCSVISWSANQGWGEQSTEYTVELVEDTCAPPVGQPKTYYNRLLVESQWTAADPGFAGHTVDIIGLPVYFRVSNWEFTGIVQSWEKVNSSDGRRYIVKLVSPAATLQHSKLIIGEYAGSVVPPSAFILPPSYTPHNIINIFGYAESEGIACPLIYQSAPGEYSLGDGGIDGAIFGTPAGGFGGSLLNDNGMPWWMIRNILNVLINASPILAASDNDAQKYSPHGRLTGKADTLTGDWATYGFGLIGSDGTLNGYPTMNYLLDISELPAVPDYLRFNQSEISILECITRICTEGGHDFYIELLPIVSGGDVHKLIKIRTKNRLYQPAFGQIDSFIATAEANNILRSSSSGREFRNEINSRFVIGGLKQTVYQAYQNFDPEGDGTSTINGVPSVSPEEDNMILPFFGADESGNMILPYLTDGNYWEFIAPTEDLEASLKFISFGGTGVVINEKELMASESIEMWSTYISETGTETNLALLSLTGEPLLNFPSYEQLYHNQIKWKLDALRREQEAFLGDWWQAEVQQRIDRLDNNVEMRASDFNQMNSAALALVDPIHNQIQEDTEKIYQWVSNFAKNYYGTQYAVRVPYSCVYLDQESNQLLLSEEPTQDGGWTEEATVLGLPLNSDELTFFRNDTNKIETIVAYTGIAGLDASAFDPESYVAYSGSMYLRGNVDSNYVYHDAATYFVPRAIVQIPDFVTSGSEPDTSIIQGMLKTAQLLGLEAISQDMISAAYETVGNKGIASVAPRKKFTPDAVAFGVKSNINTYGPWVNLGRVGGIEIEKNDGLVPWEYGGYTTLNLAGNALANSAVTNMQVGEMGNMTVVGAPTIPLGAELNGLSILTGLQLVENRVFSSDSYGGNYANGSGSFSHNFVYFDYGFVSSGAYGPTVTNISVNIGNEITTSYQMRTYTPSYGRFARLNAERLKEVNQNRMRYVRDLRNYVRNTRSKNRSNAADDKFRIKTSLGRLQKQLENKVHRPGTPHELFVGAMLPWGSSTRTIISTSSFNELPNEFSTGTYDSKAISTLDAILSPISIKGAGGLPKFIAPLIPETGTLTETPSGELTISQVDLNPYINPIWLEPSGLMNRRYDCQAFGSGLGHGFDLLSRCNYSGLNIEAGIMLSGLPASGLSMYSLPSGGIDYQQDYRTLSLRGPLTLHSWGYDTNGFPIPNHVDTASEILNNGFYQSTGQSGTFMSGFATRPDTWPVAPVNLVLNRNKGLWEAGGLCTIVRGIATTSSSSSSIPFRIDHVTFTQGSDSSITGELAYVTVDNEMGWDVSVGLKVQAQRPTGGGNYYATQVEC